ASTAASTTTLLPTAVKMASKSSTAATPSPTVSLMTTRSLPPGETPSISLIPKAGTYPAITSTASARTPSGPTGCTARRSPITTSRTSGTGRPPVRGTALPARHRAAPGPRSTPTRSATTAPARTVRESGSGVSVSNGNGPEPARRAPAVPLRPRAAAAQAMHTCLAQLGTARSSHACVAWLNAVRDPQAHHDGICAGWLVVAGPHGRLGESGTPVEQAGAGIVGAYVKEDVTAPAGCRGGNEIGEQGCPDAFTLSIAPHCDRLHVALTPADGVEARIPGDRPVRIGHYAVTRGRPPQGSNAG